LPASRTCDQFRGLDLKRIRDPPEYGDCHGRLRPLDLADVASAQPNPIGQVFLRPPPVRTKPTDIDRHDVPQIGHGASGRCRHDRSRNDASYSLDGLLLSTAIVRGWLAAAWLASMVKSWGTT
jgi:hypothetical protein